MTATTVDMTEPRRLLDELTGLIDALDGIEADVPGGESNNRDKMRRKAQQSRELIYATHVADKLRLAVQDQYHVFRGMQSPA